MVTIINTDGTLRIVLEGRIHSSNAPEIEKQILDSLDSGV